MFVNLKSNVRTINGMVICIKTTVALFTNNSKIFRNLKTISNHTKFLIFFRVLLNQIYKLSLVNPIKSRKIFRFCTVLC